MNKRNIEAIYQLSPMQEGMLFHSLYAPESGVYVEQTVCRLNGDLDARAFAEAWRKVVERHTILRTCFVWEKLDQMLQVVQREVDLPFRVEDWRALDAEEEERQWQAFLAEDIQQGFKLNKAPLLRLALFRVRDRVYRFAFSHHHALLDGWSLPLLMKEVFRFYEAFSDGKGLELPPSRPYQDYISWLQKQDLSKAENYWRRSLAGFYAPTPLTVDRIADSDKALGIGYRAQTVYLSPEQTEAIQAFARRCQLTLNNLTQGAWALLLGRYSGEEDVVFGATVAGRPVDLEGAEEMIGLLINTLPVRVKIDHQCTVLDWLQALRDQIVEMRQFEYSPLVQVQAWSEIPRHLPIFENILVFENYPVDASLKSYQGALGITDIRSREQTNYPLTVVAAPGEEMMLQVHYDTARFAPETITRMLGHWATILRELAADPRRSLGQVPMLTAEERKLVLIDWNRTQAPFPENSIFPQLFEEQVRRVPEAPAVTFEGHTLSYLELNERANRLAHYLQKLGVGPETIVGICIERSLEMAIGILGILKAGGAYLPLDPNYPAERLTFMLQDSQAKLLLTRENLLELFSDPAAGVVLLDREWERIEKEDGDNISHLAKPDNPAYLIYTSGSTGRPKGAQIVHRGLCNLVEAQKKAFGVEEGKSVLQFASFSFDASVWEMAMALGNGARLVMAQQERVASPENLHDLMKEESISIVTLPPTMLQLLSHEDLPDLEVVIAAGERCSREIAERWSAGRRFLNGYGPTEATVCATLGEYRREDHGDPSIGRPLSNSQALILDSQMQPQPIGVPGELYVGGVGLARGYWNRPDLTAERFVPNPFVELPGKYLYKTGDQVRFLPDGRIEFLGRLDDQVKIRGFRIELGEIESVLREHRALGNAAVVAHRQSTGESVLVAYYVPHQGIELSPGELRLHLKARLPEYMVPSVYLSMESLPLLPNGKLNRRALPVPEWEETHNQTAYLAPRSPEEEIMCALWSRVLKRERIGVEDDFFELGGHSLLATQLISRVREVFAIDLPVRSLFDQPTVAKLTAEVERYRLAESGTPRSVIEPAPRDRDLPLSFSQQRLWFLDQLEPDSPFYNNPLALRVKGALDKAALEQSLNAVIGRHEILRTSFGTRDGRPVQVITPSLSLTLEVEDLGHLPEPDRLSEALRLAVAEAQLPFDLSRAPLLRTRLLRLDQDDYVWLLTMHHIISDGWSLNVLIEEVSSLYRAMTAGQSAELPPLPIQYADYAVWQRNWLRGDLLDRQLQYWTERLRGTPSWLELPTDHPRPPILTSHGAQLVYDLPPELVKQVRELSRREGSTVFMTMLAAFQVLLYRLTHQPRINLGSPIANRTSAEVEGLIGFFVNTLVMNGNLEGDPKFRELLRRVREAALGAYAHQDLPFEQLVEALQPERDLSHSPLFQVMFMLQNTPRGEIDLEGLTITPFEVENQIARYDLTVELFENSGGMRAIFEYNRDLFDSPTIERMAGHYRRLLESVVGDPEQRLSALTLMAEEERNRILHEWNRTEAPFPTDRCFHQLFEEQVERQPEAIALVFEGRDVTYRELNARANQLGHYLRRLGVGPESIVGLCVDRSVEMVVSMLGVQKAGAAYLPLDPNYPAERLAFMVEDSQAPVMVTQSHLLDRLPTRETPVVLLDRDWEEIAKESPENCEGGAGPENLAYVIYTSGSTGQPKGTLLEHRGLCNLAVAQQKLFGVKEGKRVLQFSPFSFDASVWEVTMSLGSGASLVLARQETLASLEDLHDLLKRESISVATMPPSVLRLLSAEGLPALEVVIAAGEKCTREISQRWSVGRRFINAYGPTETTVCATAGEYTATQPDRDPSIGRPLPNMDVYILDENRQPVPIGTPGELYIGGVGLARGYLRRPALTEEKFIRHLFQGDPAKRLYRSGDQVRYREDGSLEYLGRVDEQVKIRGYRIELGEIEALLRQEPSIREAAVAAWEDGSGDKRLVAYLAPNSEEMPGARELKDRLRQKLPEYMVPATFVRIEKVPMTPNGKVDRKALPPPERGQFDRENEYLAPRTETEEMLARIWSELLKVPRVGIHDNFFEMGGHSLLATQIMSRLREELRIEVPLRRLFECPTIAELAAALEECRAKSTAESDRVARMLAEIDQLSEEEARALLGDD